MTARQARRKRRLVRIDIPVIVHEDPVSVHHHFPGNFSVTGFIRIPQIPLAQIQKIEDNAEYQQEADMNPWRRGDSQYPLFRNIRNSTTPLREISLSHYKRERLNENEAKVKIS
jgi:hypothetical protein